MLADSHFAGRRLEPGRWDRTAPGIWAGGGGRPVRSHDTSVRPPSRTVCSTKAAGPGSNLRLELGAPAPLRQFPEPGQKHRQVLQEAVLAKGDTAFEETPEGRRLKGN